LLAFDGIPRKPCPVYALSLLRKARWRWNRTIGKLLQKQDCCGRGIFPDAAMGMVIYRPSMPSPAQTPDRLLPRFRPTAAVEAALGLERYQK
jgi:hypothetical protein